MNVEYHKGVSNTHDNVYKRFFHLNESVSISKVIKNVSFT